MSLEWIHEAPPVWDDGKKAILGSAPPGVFDTRAHRAGQLIPGEWFRVEDDGVLVGYGWMDCTWGEAEISLVVRPDCQRRGVGTFILDHLETEAGRRRLNYLYNVVPATHPEPAALTGWLRKRRFDEAERDRLLRRVGPGAGRAG